MNITVKERLEKKVLQYLVKRGTPVVEGSVCYTGIMQDFEMQDGSRLPMHMVRYQSWVVREESAHLNVLYIDTKTEKLAIIVTPHFSRVIDLEE